VPLADHGEREVPVPEAVQQALEAWAKVHPLARGATLLDEQLLSVRLGRHGHEEPPPPDRRRRASARASQLRVRGVYRDGSRTPHALRAYWPPSALKPACPCTPDLGLESSPAAHP
jgi:integrase